MPSGKKLEVEHGQPKNTASPSTYDGQTVAAAAAAAAAAASS